MRVLIIGAGGHGQVVADILLCAREAGIDVQPVGFLDDDPSLAGATILGLPVLGPLSCLERFSYEGVIVAIGDNEIRARVFHSLQAKGERLITAVHPSAVIARDVEIGRGVMICAGVVVNTGTIIGDNTILNTGCTIDHHSRIGPHAHIAPGAHLGGHVIVGEGSLVGIGAVVLPGRKVGDWSVVGAGAVVTKDVPPHTIVVGIPAKVTSKIR